MARNLDPEDIAFAWSLRRGAIIVLPDVQRGPGGKPGAKLGSPRVLRFQYNPESITRTRTGEWEQRKNQKVPTPSQKADQNNFQGGGLFTKSEAIQMKLVFDATELLLRGEGAAAGATGGLDPQDVGVLPELAVLEQIAIAEPPKGDEKKTDKQADKLNVIRPKELLLVLGPRYFPVIVTSLTITEKRFGPNLVPVRAEVDLQMQVMEPTETSGDQAIKAAFDLLVATRKKHAAAATADVALDVDKLGKFTDDLNEVVDDAVARALNSTPQGGI